MKDIKLQQVLDNNRKWPMVIIGATAKEVAGENRLIIENLDEKTFEEQEHFVTLLKDRRHKGKKIPDNVQIIIPIKDKEKLSKKIQSLVLSWTYEE